MVAGKKNEFSGSIQTSSARLRYHLFLILFFVFFYFPLLTGMGHMWEDVIKQHYPNLIYTLHSLHEGHLPLWTPHIFGGMPHLADLQTAVFYPPQWLLFLFAGIAPGKEILLAWFILGHVLLFGYGIFHLSLNLGMNRIASLYAATALMFCGFVSLHVHHPNALYVIAWFPWSFLNLKKYYEKRKSRYLGYASLCFGISILGGYSQYTAFCSLILLFYTLYFIWIHRRQGWRTNASTGSGFLLFLLFSLGLASVQLLPTTGLFLKSVRTSMSWTESARGSLSAGNLITLLAPKFFGQVRGVGGITFWKTGAFYQFWETAIFIGVLPLILLTFHLPYRNHRRYFIFFLTLGFFGLAMSLGKHLPFYPLLFKIPGFNLFRIPGRFSFIFSLGFIMASAISFNDLQRQSSDTSQPPKKGIITAGILSIILAGILIMAPHLIEIPRQHRPASMLSLYVALASLLISWLLILWAIKSRNKIPPRMAMVVWVFFELFLFGHGFAPGPMGAKQVYPPTGELLKLKSQMKTEPFRLCFRNQTAGGQGNRGILYENLGNVYGLDTVNGYNQLQLLRFHRFITGIEFEKALSLLNTKYLVTVKGREISKSRTLKSCARFNLRSHILPVGSGQEALDKINSRSFNPLRQAVVEGSLTLSMNKDIPPPLLGSVRIISLGSRRIILDIRAARNCLLFASEVWYPAWRARLNGREVPMVRTNYLFRGVEIPSGRHRLTIYYRSGQLTLGKWISLFFLITIAMIMFAPLLVAGLKEKKPGKWTL